MKWWQLTAKTLKGHVELFVILGNLCPFSTCWAETSGERHAVPLSRGQSEKRKKKRSDKNLKTSSGQRAASQISTSPAFFSYLHEKLGAFGHEQLEDEGRREAGNRAENHKQPPALKVQKAHRKMGPGRWNHQPGQTCEHRHCVNYPWLSGETKKDKVLKSQWHQNSGCHLVF